MQKMENSKIIKEITNRPMIIYIDVNYETTTEYYRKFEALINKLGLKSWKSKDWTRYNPIGKNSNIDVIVYSMQIRKIIKVQYLQHKQDLSDHKGIRVTIENKEGFITEFKKR